MWEKNEGRRLDGIGAFTCAADLLGLLFGIIQINQVGLLHPWVLESLAVGIGALLAFVWWERRAGDPLLDITLFHNRTVFVAVTTGLLPHWSWARPFCSSSISCKPYRR